MAASSFSKKLITQLRNGVGGGKTSKSIAYATLFVLILLPSKVLPATESASPNVLFIAIDDMNDWLGCLEGYRYIQYEGGGEELYDMQTDPQEWKNLAEDEAYNEVLAEMREHVPTELAPLAKGSTYDINPYFRERLEKWGRGGW